MLDSNHHLTQRSWVIGWDGSETARIHWTVRISHFPLEKSMGRLGKRGSWSSPGPEMGHLHPLRKVKWWQAIGYGYPIPKALRRCYLQQAWYIAILHGVPMFQNPWNLALHNLSWHQRQHLEFSCVPMFQMSPPGLRKFVHDTWWYITYAVMTNKNNGDDNDI